MFLLRALQACSRMTNSKLLKMCDLTVRGYDAFSAKC
jgi:hypothetical protein